MTDSDRNLWHDRCEELRKVSEELAKKLVAAEQKLVRLENVGRELIAWHDAQNWDARHPIGIMRELRELVPEVKHGCSWCGEPTVLTIGLLGPHAGKSICKKCHQQGCDR